MLDYCTAVICTSSLRDETFLGELAGKLGFGRVLPYGLEPPEAPITFFLVHSGVTEEDKSNLVTAVRSDRMFRFSPVLLIGEERRPGARTLTEYEQAGFDDALIVDDDVPRLRGRIESQLREEQIYYSTQTYFGPDRRRWERRPTRVVPRQEPPAAYDSFRFRRDPLSGVRLIEHVVVGQSAAVPTVTPAPGRQLGRH